MVWSKVIRLNSAFCLYVKKAERYGLTFHYQNPKAEKLFEERLFQVKVTNKVEFVGRLICYLLDNRMVKLPTLILCNPCTILDFCILDCEPEHNRQLSWCNHSVCSSLPTRVLFEKLDKQIIIISRLMGSRIMLSIVQLVWIKLN